MIGYEIGLSNVLPPTAAGKYFLHWWPNIGRFRVPISAVIGALNAALTGTIDAFVLSRCANVDLGNWFQGKYAIPVVDAADDTIIEALLADGMTPLQNENDR